MDRGIRRIATEEAFATPAQMEAMGELVASHAEYDADLFLWQIQADPAGPFNRGLLDLEHERLQIMDRDAVDMHVLSLTSPGVQMLDARRAIAVARSANDLLAAVIARHPTRFAGLATVPPQDVDLAIEEARRAIHTLKLNGIIINSHTDGEYLYAEKYRPLLQAIAALDVPLYLHPRAPIPAMAPAFYPHHVEHAIWGYQAETGLHAFQMMISGLFDAVPDLRVVLGHLGEGIPYWLYRLDHFQDKAAKYLGRPKLERRLSEYFKRNFIVTTSGMNWNPTLSFCIEVLGADNIMWAIDYPYQASDEAVRFMNDAPISPEQRAKIYHRNAERVFKIAPLEAVR